MTILMSKFTKANFKTVCKQTGIEINIGDPIYYFPGRGAFHSSSAVYQSKMEELRKDSLQSDRR